MIPNILSIAGSDSSGGAGIQADIKAISANGGYAMTAITALTAQNTRGVSSVHLCPPDMLLAQIAALRADVRIDAVKIGMLGDVALTRAVAGALEGLACPIVLDPVMVAKGGDRLLAETAVMALRETLLLIGSIAVRPCTGALFVLIITLQMGIAGVGIAGAFAMAFGTATITIAVGLGAGALRGGVLAGWASTPRAAQIAALIELAAGLAVALLAGGLLLRAI